MLPWVSPLLFAKRAAAAGFYVDLDGTSEGFKSTAAVVLGVADAWTIMVHCKPTAPTLVNIVRIRTSTADDSSATTLTGGAAAADLLVDLVSNSGTNYKERNFPGVFAQNVGVHLVVTYNGAVAGDPVVAYKNGVEVTGATGINTPAAVQSDEARILSIATNATGSGFTAMHLESVALWSSALTAAEAAALYDGRKTLDLVANSGAYVSSATLKHWYRPWKDSTAMGKDYAIVGTRVNLDSVGSLDASDIFSGAIS